MRATPKRRGMATLWALLILAAVTALAAAALSQAGTTRQRLAAEKNRAQAGWLARSGVELAVAQLAANASYTGETAKPFAGGEVTIAVVPEGGSFRIASEAHVGGVRATAARTVRRTPKSVETVR